LKYLKKLKDITCLHQDQTNFFSRVDDLSRRAGMLGCNPDGLFRPPKNDLLSDSIGITQGDGQALAGDKSRDS